MRLTAVDGEADDRRVFPQLSERYRGTETGPDTYPNGLIAGPGGHRRRARRPLPSNRTQKIPARLEMSHLSQKGTIRTPHGHEAALAPDPFPALYQRVTQQHPYWHGRFQLPQRRQPDHRRVEFPPPPPARHPPSGDERSQPPCPGHLRKTGPVYYESTGLTIPPSGMTPPSLGLRKSMASKTGCTGKQSCPC